MSRPMDPRPPAGWHQQHRAAVATDDDRERAKWLLANVSHYRAGCINERDDIQMIAKGLAAMREGA